MLPAPKELVHVAVHVSYYLCMTPFEQDTERAEWLEFSLQRLARAYHDDEESYDVNNVKALANLGRTAKL